ncbi:MAG: threonine ammonia-lyase [Candidatus Coproplasma sp.]
MLTLDKVYHAHYVLKEAIRQTDLIYSPVLSKSSGCELYLKTENLQVTGSFKVRGAYYKISQLTDEEKARGVIACSAGNHAQGVALASKKFKIKSIICMPDGAPISKVEATKSYGAEVVLVPGVYDDAHNRAEELKAEKGYTFIHPFDDEEVIAGQGTIGLEIIDQLKDVDAIVVPIGGGGLISGVAFAVKSLNPKVKVYGVQAAGAPSMLNSIDHGKIELLPSVSTIADGIAVKEPGTNTFELCSKYVDKVVSVTDDQISAAILALIEKQKMIAEGAGAVALAAVMFGKIPDVSGKKVVCLVSGGNIDVTILSRVINRGLLMSGRQTSLTVELMDKPGQLVAVSTIVAECGGNVTAVLHERSNEGTDVNGCYLKLQIETRNFEHIKQIKNKLKQNGFKVIGE